MTNFHIVIADLIGDPATGWLAEIATSPGKYGTVGFQSSQWGSLFDC